MANEKRLIDANALLRDAFYCVDEELKVVDIVDIENATTVDAVEVSGIREFAEDVACQFGYYCQNGGRLHITHGGLSTLEWAFDILGWENPHPVPEYECEIDGCHEHATCGTPTADGYKRVCGRHFCSIRTKMDGDGNG